MHHLANLLEEYQLANDGAYPEPYRVKEGNWESLPADYWDEA